MKLKLLVTTDVNLQRMKVPTEFALSRMYGNVVTIEHPLTVDLPMENWVGNRVTFYNGSGIGVFSIVPREVTLGTYSYSDPSVGVMADVNVIEIKTKYNKHFFYTEELQLESCTCVRR